MLYRLIILNGDRKGQQVTVPEEPLMVGRGTSCSLRLNDTEIALSHAVIEHRGSVPTIRDLGTMNKVLVNNAQVSQANLKHGDIIEIGRTRFLVQAFVQAEVQGLPAHRRRRAVRAFAAAAVLAVAAGAATHRLWPRLHPKPPAPQVFPVAVTPQGDVMTPSATTEPFLPDLTANDALARKTDDGLPPAIAGPVEPPANPLADKVSAMMAEALSLSSNRALSRADEVLRSIVMIVPDHAPAYAERARLFTRRGMLDPAIEQWEEVIRLAPGTELSTEGEASRTRLLAAHKAPLPEFAGRIRIAAADHSRFPQTEEFSEMRSLSVTLRPDSPQRELDASAVRVEVRFFDRDTQSGSIRPTSAAAAVAPISVPAPWAPGEEKTVTATYAVPARGETTPTAKALYYGCAVRVYYYGALQDAWAQPRELLTEKAEPSPPEAVATQAPPIPASENGHT